jgi:polyadenylate-binding protein
MALFKEHGKIISCKLETDTKGESKGYGYVQFEKAEDAKTAIEKLNGMEVGESKKKIDVNVLKKIDQRGPATVDKFTNLFV